MSSNAEIETAPNNVVADEVPERAGFQSEKKFTIYFDGEAHDYHKIKAKMLASALSAVSDVLHDSAKLITGDAEDIDVEVSDKFKEGSFGVEIAVIFSDPAVMDILRAYGFSLAAGGGVVAGTVLETLHLMKGKAIDVVETDDIGNVSIHYDGKRVNVSSTVATLVADKKIRADIKKLIADPLSSPGTDIVKVTVPKELADQALEDEDEQTVFRAVEAEAQSFGTLQAETVEAKSEQEVRVRFLSANIDKKTGWRIQMPDETVLRVSMMDDVFRERLQIMEEPHIFGREFPVRLQTVEKLKLGLPQKPVYNILNVRVAA